MNDILVRDFPIARLEYAFRAMGLPLIAKTREHRPTTSILIRGGAGAGKTTLGVALAHAMARDTDGTALYLATEFVATEVAYKARMLGLADELVSTLDQPGPFAAGVLLAEHLLRTRAGANVTTSVERKRAAIEAVWELIRPGQNGDSAGDGGHAPSLADVRVVVIDSFGLPDSEDEEKHLRDELMTLVQTLESYGVSVVLLEEKSQSTTHWLPFVVDIVFEIQMLPDPDTGELLRKLMCPKSRYATSVPGPHDYELDHEGRPCVWPDPLSVPAERLASIRERVASPGFFLPVDNTHFIKVVTSEAGAILLSAGDSLVLDVVEHTPGLGLCTVDCGPTTTISKDALEPRRTILAHQGPYALAWTLLEWAAAGRIRAVRLQVLEYFLARVRFRVGMGHVLDALRNAGLIIVVHGRTEELESVVPLADYVTGGHYRRHETFEPRSMPRSPVCWLPLMQRDAEAEYGFGFWDRVLGQLAPDQYWEFGLEQSMLALLLGLARGTRSFQDLYTSVATLRQSVGAWSSRIVLLLAWQANLTDAVDLETRGVRLSPTEEIRAALLTGRDIAVGSRILSLAHDQQELFERHRSYWYALCALYGRNRAALDEVDQVEASSRSVLLHGLFLRALAAHRMHERLEQELARLMDQQDIPPWYAARIRVETRLEPRDLEPHELDAVIQAMDELLGEHGPLMPEVHRAEVLYNRGIAYERRGQAEQARNSFQAALEVNPHLEIAREHLASAD